MSTIKAEWIYSIIMALKARVEYTKDESLEERDVAKEALDYFESLGVELK